ncbi:MAG TPA: hypothetical protein VK608_05070 [Edaphobacter sp.]|nr:hypothetical protein [Edaphobacter sp.]
MSSQRGVWSQFALVLCLALISLQALGQDSPARRGRKYKPPPDTSHIEVQVLKHATGKPIMNAAVVFNPTKDGKDLGSLEVKTNPDGKAIIDVIPTGSTVRVQVIANGYATYAQDFQVDEPTREIEISMLRPKEQVSAYEDNTGKASSRKPGVQEPIRPKPAAKPDPTTTPAPATPAPTAPQQ